MNREAIEDMANTFNEISDKGDSIHGGVLDRLSDVCDEHNVTSPEERIELIMAGIEHNMDREKQKILSDLRENLESQYRLLGYDFSR